MDFVARVGLPIDLAAETVLRRYPVDENRPSVVSSARERRAQLTVMGKGAVTARAVEARQCAQESIDGGRLCERDRRAVEHGRRERQVVQVFLGSGRDAHRADDRERANEARSLAAAIDRDP
ncbi:MAG: hypothetical protein NVS1B2_03880 [Vulcanimicrobiaceae bacterium]